MDYATDADAFEVVPEMTQEGIVEAAGIDLRHFMQYVRPLTKEGLVRERTAHVKGSRQRRKTYGLTDAGRIAAVRLRDQVRTQTVRIRDADAIREVPVGRLAQEVGGKGTLLGILRQAAEDETVEVGALVPARPTKFVEMVADAPRVEHFVGRREELAAIMEEGEAARIVVVRGVAGIGKTSLAAKACDLLRGKRNLYWHVVRSWDTHVSLLAALGDFLAAVGKPGLRAVVQRGSVEKAPQVLREDLVGTRSFLVFDDVHEVSTEALPFFRLLAEAVAQVPDARVLVLTRERPRFYSRRDVTLKGLVREFDLAGLAPEEAAAHLAADPQLVAAIPRSSRFLGLPLFLELVRAHGTAPSAALRDVRGFLEEEVYAKLSDSERRMMKVATFYRVPVPEVALFADPDSGPDVLLSLVNRSLVRPVGEDRYEVHDTVRDFFSELASPSERQRFGSFAVDQLCRLASEASENRRFAACAGYLSNTLTLVEFPADRASLWEALGEATRHQGDVLAALVAYREAAQAAAGPEMRARMHRRAALALLDRGEVNVASAEVEEGLRDLGDRGGPERGWLELARCRALYLRGERDEAWTHGQTALEFLQEAVDHDGLAHAHFQLADMGRYGTISGQVALVEHHLQAASELANPKSNPFLLANIHFAWGASLSQRGDFEAAERHLVAVEAIPRVLEDDQVRRRLLEVRGVLRIEGKGDLSAAREDFVELLRLSRGVRDAEGEAEAKYWLSNISGLEGKPNEARSLMAEVAEDRAKRGITADNALYWAGVFGLMEGNLREFRRFPSRPRGSEAATDERMACVCKPARGVRLPDSRRRGAVGRHAGRAGAHHRGASDGVSDYRDLGEQGLPSSLRGPPCARARRGGRGLPSALRTNGPLPPSSCRLGGKGAPDHGRNSAGKGRRALMRAHSPALAR